MLTSKNIEFLTSNRVIALERYFPQKDLLSGLETPVLKLYSSDMKSELVQYTVEVSKQLRIDPFNKDTLVEYIGDKT